MIDIPTLDTARLRLRPSRLEDFEAYAAMWAEPKVVRFIGGGPMSGEAAWSRFLRQIGSWHHLGFGFWMVESRDTGRFIGEAGFHDLHRALTPSIEGTLEAGWVLTPAAQGQGLAEEAMRAALSWADTRHPALRQTCIIRPDHAASLRIAEKLGFRPFARSDYNAAAMVLLERSRPATGEPGQHQAHR